MCGDCEELMDDGPLVRKMHHITELARLLESGMLERESKEKEDLKAFINVDPSKFKGEGDMFYVRSHTPDIIPEKFTSNIRFLDLNPWRWIPVTEKLPPLVTEKIPNQNEMVLFINGKNQIGYGWCFDYNNASPGAVWFNDEILIESAVGRYWMPIPPLPETSS